MSHFQPAMLDPEHFKSDDNPCQWCGAKWGGQEGESIFFITHAANCEYILAMDESEANSQDNQEGI